MTDMYGIDEEEMLLLQNIFSKTKNLEEVILYGSRAKGNYKPFSDIDITLKGEHLCDDDLSDINYELSESSLPYFCNVSIYHRLNSPALIDHINRRGKVVYRRTSQ